MRNLLDLGIMPQGLSYDCGYYSDKAILEYWGITASIRRLKNIALEAQSHLVISQEDVKEGRGLIRKNKDVARSHNRKYPSLEATGAIAIAKEYNLAGVIMLGPTTREMIESIDDELPVLFDWYLRPDAGHWSVIKGYVRGSTIQNGRIRTWFKLADSADSARTDYFMRRPKLFRQWSGGLFKREYRRAIIQWPRSHPEALEFREKYRGMQFGSIPREPANLCA